MLRFSKISISILLGLNLSAAHAGLFDSIKSKDPALRYSACPALGAEPGSSTCAEIDKALLQALERGRSGVPLRWKTDKQIFGEITPFKPRKIDGLDCRDFQIHAFLPKLIVSKGTLCRSNQGDAWSDPNYTESAKEAPAAIEDRSKGSAPISR